MRRLLPLVLLAASAVPVALPANAAAHQSGCHRWHSCPSDTGSYTCGDLGYYTYCGYGPRPPTAIPEPPPGTDFGNAMYLTGKEARRVARGHVREIWPGEITYTGAGPCRRLSEIRILCRVYALGTDDEGDYYCRYKVVVRERTDDYLSRHRGRCRYF